MRRRQFFYYGVCAGVFLLSACKGSSQSSKSNDKLQLPSFSEYNLKQALDKLLAAYESKGLTVRDSLLPGIDAAKLMQRCTWFPGDMIPEIQALYAWHGGQEKGAWETDHPFWFRDNAFLNLDNAESEYASMMESYGSEFSDQVWMKYAFPFAAFNGAWYVIPTRGHPFSPNLKYPIVSIFEGIDVFYYSIETMVQTCIDWVSHVDYNKDGTLPRDVEMTIWRRHNPGIFNNG